MWQVRKTYKWKLSGCVTSVSSSSISVPRAPVPPAKSQPGDGEEAPTRCDICHQLAPLRPDAAAVPTRRSAAAGISS